jgi:hypothetical protein
VEAPPVSADADASGCCGVMNTDGSGAHLVVSTPGNPGDPAFTGAHMPVPLAQLALKPINDPSSASMMLRR